MRAVVVVLLLLCAAVAVVGLVVGGRVWLVALGLLLLAATAAWGWCTLRAVVARG